jgi:hypothetical protein
MLSVEKARVRILLIGAISLGCVASILSGTMTAMSVAASF